MTVGGYRHRRAYTRRHARSACGGTRGDPDALFARAAIHAASGRRAEAIVILDELAKIAPGYPGLWRFKARLYQEVGDGRRAALCLGTADREEPTWRN